MKKGNKATNATKAESEPQKPLSLKEIEKQIRRGQLNAEQAIKLRQKYMDSLEYKEERFVTACGGIRPLPILLPLNKEP